MPCLVIALAAVVAIVGCSADSGGGASDASRTGGSGSAGLLASTGGASEPGTGGRDASTIVGTPEELADIYARAAVAVGSCLPDDQGGVFYDGIACESGTLVSCVYGREHRLDCASVAPGFTCQTHAGASFCGIAAECAPAAPAEGSGPDESCEGDTVVFCNAGRLERIDCTSLGFERCEATNGATCAPTSTDGLP